MTRYEGEPHPATGERRRYEAVPASPIAEARKTEASLFPRDPLCTFCGGVGSYESPLTFSTWGLGFVSEPFPAHRGCAEDYGYDRVTEAEMREALA